MKKVCVCVCDYFERKVVFPLLFSLCLSAGAAYCTKGGNRKTGSEKLGRLTWFTVASDLAEVIFGTLRSKEHMLKFYLSAETTACKY